MTRTLFPVVRVDGIRRDRGPVEVKSVKCGQGRFGTRRTTVENSVRASVRSSKGYGVLVAGRCYGAVQLELEMKGGWTLGVWRSLSLASHVHQRDGPNGSIGQAEVEYESDDGTLRVEILGALDWLEGDSRSRVP